MMRNLIITILMIMLLSAAFFLVAKWMDPTVTLTVQKAQLQNFLHYIRQGSTISDTLKAFGLFLKRYMGYWDSSSVSLAAFLVSLTLGIVALSKKPPLLLSKTITLLLALIIFKSIFIFHTVVFSSAIMPPGTVFPSLLFFCYYYVYCDAILLTLILILLLNQALTHRKIFVLCLILVSLSNAAHVLHVKEEAQHRTNDIYSREEEKRGVREDMALPTHILAAQKFARELPGPIYFSFPTGNNALFKRTLFHIDSSSLGEDLDAGFIQCNSIIPVLYLRYIEDGRVITSLKNAGPKRPFLSAHELVNARFFLDIPSGQVLDLELIRKTYGENRLVPQVASKTLKQAVDFFPAYKSPASAVFFVKGSARINLKGNHFEEEAEQSYGQSYQSFRFPIPEGSTEKDALWLVLSPHDPQESVSLVGPFIISDQDFRNKQTMNW